MMTRYYCTYFDRHYLARGLALIESLQREEPASFVIYVVCMDEMTRIVLNRLAIPQVRTIPMHEIEQHDDCLFAIKPTRSLVEYYWTLTPTVILRILQRHRDIDVLTYVDADLFFFSSPQPLFDELGEGSILIHEHGFSPRQAHLAEHNGRYNVGLLSFRRDPNGLAALHWWRERCLEWCFARYEQGKMGDQVYLNDWPTRFAGVVVLTNPGGGVGPWNHDRYDVQLARGGHVMVDHSPVIFFHFHSLKLGVAELALPVAHAHYPLTLNSLRYCFVPYLRALGDGHNKVIRIVPTARWGLEDSLEIGPQLSFLARSSVKDRLLGKIADRQRISLSEDWDAYCSEQVIDSGWPTGAIHQKSEPVSMPRIAQIEPVRSEERRGSMTASSQHNLLMSLEGTEVALQVRTLYVGGAHRFQEHALFDRLFPNLRHLYLFEPIPELALNLRRFEGLDPRIKVFDYALSDRNETSEFFLTNNDGESSSLLRLGKHREIFPHVQAVRSIHVACRTLDRVIEDHRLEEPDMLLLDVQGAEHRILAALSAKVKRRLRALYVEASLEEVYEGAKCLEDVVAVLEPDHRLVSFSPLSPASPTHGNALFVRRQSCPQQDAVSPTQHGPGQPLISVIISSYAAEAFMRECLDDLERQTVIDRMEIIVVDAASPEGEGAIVAQYQERYKNIVYLRTPTRIGVYAAWNLAVKLARGRYITPFSTNDRLRLDAYEILSNSLADHPEVSLVYGDTSLTDLPHQTFEHHHSIGMWKWPDYSYDYLLTHCTVGPHPMWRRSLHDTVGYFDESYIALGDQDFWIRIGAQHNLMHIPFVTGLYWKSTAGLSNRPEIYIPEERRLRETYGNGCTQSMPVAEVGATYDCSVVMPVWNRYELTRQCLEALAKTTGGVSWELIIVDNHSTDGTAAFLETLGGDIRVITNEDNVGFARACNQGAHMARGKYIVFLNNDTIPLDGWLQELLNEVESYPEVGIVGSKLLYADGTIQHAGVVMVRGRCAPYHIYRGCPSGVAPVNQRREFQVVTGACLLIRRELFDEVGGFDEGFRNGFEDVDLCLKVGQKGHRIVYQPRSVLYHLESQTPGRKAFEIENSARLQERWKDHWWLADEDLHYYADGCKLIRDEVDGVLAGQLQPLTDARDRAAWAHVAAIQAAALKKDWVAVKWELQMVDEWPNDRLVLSWGGMVADRLQEPVFRARFLARYLKLADVQAERLKLIRMFLEQKNLLGAEEQLRILLDVSPDHAEGLVLKGILCMQHEQFGQAELAFSAALRQGAERRKCLMGMGMAAMGRAYTQGAWERFLEVLAEHPDDGEAIHWLLRAGTAQNRWQELGEHLHRYTTRNPGDLAARFALTGVLLRGEQIEAARREYDALCKVDASYDGLEQLGQAISWREAVLTMKAASS
ncbi:MAG: FkbM family methyltransferase [Nitrospira sp.]|nr:FkbM family methyltransferase [Nitrospira sp.]MDH4302532.1 FkbM family methyltransferase [Nitrospira sp.]MDH5193341.1 FkbM family methyltransferase [Nitrospira sp.]